MRQLTLDQHDQPTRGGFTLIELLLVTAISSLVLAALAAGIGIFGESVEQLRIQSDTGPDEALALMTDMSRHGWSVEHADDGRLDIVDAAGGLTRFSLDDDVLSITRPSGASGVLLDGVESLAIESDTIGRLREDTPISDYRTWWEATGPSDETLQVEPALPVGLGFTMASAVPDDYDTLADVDEQAVQATLQTLVISMSYLGTIPPDPNEPTAGEEPENGNGHGNGHGNGNSCNGNGNKVAICHVPPGNPGNAHTLEVASAAVDAHLAHGDLLGPCDATPDPASSSWLAINLYEARAPDDARPFGPSLGSMSLPATALPAGTAEWVLTSPAPPGSTHDHDPQVDSHTTCGGKVIVCHVPPGNPANAHTISISHNAVNAHLAHGDYLGCCGDHDGGSDVFVLEQSPPEEVALDLSPLGAVILPGRAYTLTFELQGKGFVHIGGAELGTHENSGVAQAALAGGDLMPSAMRVPFELQGMQAITQTSEHQPISRVSIALDMLDGKRLMASSNVLSQVAVPGEWLGVVPGQLEVLEQ